MHAAAVTPKVEGAYYSGEVCAFSSLEDKSTGMGGRETWTLR